MSKKLISYTKSSNKILKKILTLEDENIQSLQKIFILIRNRTGNDFSQYKKSTINRRIGRRMNIHQIEELSQYLQYLQENPHGDRFIIQRIFNKCNALLQRSLAFESLKKGALKRIIKSKADNDILRVWVPGCSTGEEVYSIAIIIRELLEETGKIIGGSDIRYRSR